MRMGKRALCVALCLCLALGGLAACAAEETDEELTGVFTDLLAADYEVYYLFCSGGLPVDGAVTQVVEGVEYHPVSSARYRDLASLRELLEQVYAQKDQVEALLAVEDPDGNPLLAVEDGKLLRSATQNIYAMGYEVVEGTVSLRERGEDSASFTFQETGLDGSLYRTAMSMTRTRAGWRLDVSRAKAERELLREGSDQLSAVEPGAARLLAEEFLAALEAGDRQALDRLTLGQSSYEGVQVSSARITETLEEQDSFGDYVASLRVEDGAGILAGGSGDYRLRVGYADFGGDIMSPVYFRPVEEEYYNWMDYTLRDSAPANAVEWLIEWFGPVSFQTPAELDRNLVADHALITLASRTEEWERVYTPEEVAAQVESTFGVNGFDARNTKYYSAEKGGCIIWGRGGRLSNRLTRLPVLEDGRASVTVDFYQDPLCTRRIRRVEYLLEENPDGSWRFLSALSQPAG